MINHKYKCIFIHIHKTAGGAIWPSFDNYNPNNDAYIYQMPNGEQFQVGRTTIK